MEQTDRARERGGDPVARGFFVARRSGNFGFGLALVALGVLLTVQQLGLMPDGFWRDGWPWVIVFLGAVQVVTARTAGGIGDGVSFALLGVWLLMVESHWYGLTWRNSWPLALAAIGAGIVVHAIAGMFLPESQAKGGREGRLE